MLRPTTLISVAALSLLGCESDRKPPPGNPSRTDSGVGVTDVGVNDAGEVDDAGLDAGVADVGVPISIPDPGVAMNDWGNTVINVCCSTPDTAYPVGVVTMDSGYVQGNIDAVSGNFFYVFRAGPALTQLTW